MRAGFVALIGRPNAGKSTLLNALVGERVAIVTSKPQTTRNRILGVVETKFEMQEKAGDAATEPAPSEDAQIVLIDTPGVHEPETQLDRRLMQEVHEALESCDVVALLVDVTRRLRMADPAATSGNKRGVNKLGVDKRGWGSEDEQLMRLLKATKRPVVLVLNKIDAVRRQELLPLIDELRAAHDFAAVYPISARKRDGVERLVRGLAERMPEGERYFPAEQFTDQPVRFLVAEIIRERILMETGEEVPYASAVVIERFEEPQEPTRKAKKPRMLKGGVPAPERRPLTRIVAAIYCEREGQRAILIGSGGSRLKSIGASAREQIEKLLETAVYLELRVIVEEGWRQSQSFVERLDWRRQLEEMAARQAGEGARELKKR